MLHFYLQTFLSSSFWTKRPWSSDPQVTVVSTAAESAKSTVMSVRACGAPSTPAAPVGPRKNRPGSVPGMEI